MARKSMLRGVFMAIAAVCMFLPASVMAEENTPCVFFAPESMNENNEISVPVYTKNLPKNNDGLCGTEFRFAYDTEHFTIKTDDNGRPVLGTGSAMLVQNTDAVEVSEEDGIVSASYVDFGGERNLVLRDGPLFFFTLIPKNPTALWNSDDYYPLRFLPGSVNLITLDRKNMSLSGTAAEGSDTYVGGYNAFPTFEIPKSKNIVEFRNGNSAVYVNGEAVLNDAPPYEKDGEMMIPVRFLAEALGMELSWDQNTSTVALYWPYRSVYLTLDDSSIYINAKLRQDLPKIELKNDRTYVSLSSVREIFGGVLEIDRSADKAVLKFSQE